MQSYCPAETIGAMRTGRCGGCRGKEGLLALPRTPAGDGAGRPTTSVAVQCPVGFRGHVNRTCTGNGWGALGGGCERKFCPALTVKPDGWQEGMRNAEKGLRELVVRATPEGAGRVTVSCPVAGYSGPISMVCAADRYDIMVQMFDFVLKLLDFVQMLNVVLKMLDFAVRVVRQAGQLHCQTASKPRVRGEREANVCLNQRILCDPAELHHFLYPLRVLPPVLLPEPRRLRVRRRVWVRVCDRKMRKSIETPPILVRQKADNNEEKEPESDSPLRSDWIDVRIAAMS